ncbi:MULTISPECIES: helix-turn-helix transcriptional regulator [Pseudonocardia]|uniref:Oxygen regulatory protein NreC n=2 Tax=Pseudonocardia TaxID=1847 RepID=A0A1Y2N7V9_PSEAH|nr:MULTISPECIES: response regulator transcription factor [Pseudonocardia]OSY43546.1 Oxygen regulatory protein NreC [Pseudonocardia autotrophica]TDN73463.1 DNA-binding NarL/FixJ family response regulator [Pseudonocardia autotrophica]BBG04203.1 putative two-component system response regulator, LuxR family protein [Pseudonocardia autotrophica]GEC25534.1 putative two-component system response regulator, LuxR family protein [Pseudonocardia saturnea]
MQHDTDEREAGSVVVGDPPVPRGWPVLGRTAAGPAEAVAAAVVRVRPALVIVDLAGSRAVGLAAVAAVVARVPAVPVLAVAAPGAEHELVLDAVRAGATGVATTDDPVELLPVARAALAGRPAFSPGLAAVVLESMVTPARPVPELSPRESEVLRLVVEGLTARQIAARLVLSPRTVENHVQRLLRKLDVPGRGALVRYAIEHGLA